MADSFIREWRWLRGHLNESGSKRASLMKVVLERRQRRLRDKPAPCCERIALTEGPAAVRQ
ncbi:hypothetical protein [Aeromonas sp. RU39B]|uniref:hypothetical protein n=1 Tax=Aeromonas sp. RU39B TaxID=1907416 RepID=UPI001177F8E3|nr:hypothetical protein [Aeromonas sp. RU39B]